ncbi:MAG: hypothetical protein KAS23_00425, partial [Anaerohalosphaera sp.]|nr:hypothetical protein [Anaerohalosphaera sp.]
MRGKWISVMSLCVLILSSVVFSEETNKTDFTGTVIDSDGAAIEDASLVLYMVTIDQAAFGYQVKPLSKVKSDASGKFAFEVNVPEASGNSIYCCLAQKEELACGWACAISVNSATWQITLGEPKMMIGFVRDPDGTAIADAEVRLIILSIAGRQDQFMFGVEPVEAFVTKTSSDGRFEFNNLPKDATAEFLVKKSGKGTLHTLDAAMNPEAGLTYKAGQTDIVLTMQGACKVSGTVVTKEGQKPVGGVSLMIMEANLPINLINNPVKSGDDGIFEFEDLSPGDYKVQILDDNWIAEPASVTVAGDTDAEVKIELIKGGTLEVKVIDSETKKAVAGTTVNFREEQTRQNQSFSTDNNGIGNKQVMPGTYSISVYKQGYRASRDAGTVVVDNGKTATLTVEFGSQPKITGLVTDPQGKPVEGAVIRIVPGGGSNRDGIKSDEKGQFSMAWDPGRSGFAEGEFFLT